MSDPAGRDLTGMRHSQDDQPPSNLPQDQQSAQRPVQDTPPDPSVDTAPLDTLSQLRALVTSLKKPPNGKGFRCMCKDGVLRRLHFLPTPPDHPTKIAVYDAIPLSPEMLKMFLDRQMPWSQEVEYRFRGVDGTSVPQEQWLHPPPGVIPSRGSKNDRDKERVVWEKRNEELKQKIERGEVSAEEAGPACGSGGVSSNFDLRPR